MPAEAGVEAAGILLCRLPGVPIMAAAVDIQVMRAQERRETDQAMPAAREECTELEAAVGQALLAVMERAVLAARAELARHTLILVQWSLMQAAVAVLVQQLEDPAEQGGAAMAQDPPAAILRMGLPIREAEVAALRAAEPPRALQLRRFGNYFRWVWMLPGK